MTKVESESKRGVAWGWLALAWGFAEAVCFFIVPDVLTSRIVLRDTRRGYLACVIATFGAVAGGALLFQLGRTDAALLPAMDHIPGISESLIEQARSDLALHGLLALFSGALGGIPYKLFAVQAAATDASFVPFLLMSVVARLVRLALVTSVAWLPAGLMSGVSMRTKYRVHAALWAVFYLFYFWKNGI